MHSLTNLHLHPGVFSRRHSPRSPRQPPERGAFSIHGAAGVSMKYTPRIIYFISTTQSVFLGTEHSPVKSRVGPEQNSARKAEEENRKLRRALLAPGHPRPKPPRALRWGASSMRGSRAPVRTSACHEISKQTRLSPGSGASRQSRLKLNNSEKKLLQCEEGPGRERLFTRSPGNISCHRAGPPHLFRHQRILYKQLL